MAFHPYPQLIPSVFNLSGFAPPQSLTSASHWPWVDHPASGPEHATHTLIRIRFRYGSPHSWLTTQHATDSQAHSSKGTPPPHHKRGGYDGLSAHGFRYSFTPLPGYFSPFPHGTYSTIGHAKYLGLPGGPGKFTTDSTSPPLLRKHNNHINACFRVPDSHRLWQAIPHHFH